jgi:hypothetical protein
MSTDAQAHSLDGMLAHAKTFIDLVPVTYLLAKARYPFLPTRTVSLDVFWADASPLGRAVFLLDYVAALYQRTAAQAAMVAQLGDRPIAIFRTLDHPQAAGVTHPADHDPRAYSVFFDVDSGVRIELHLGQTSFVGLAMVLQHFGRA